MKKLVACSILLASCSGQGELIPTPSPAPETSTTATTIISAALAVAQTPPETEPPPATIPATTEYLRPVATTAPRSSSSTLASIRACESGGDYSTNTGNGYYGAYQFSLGTWQSVGGVGNPANASPAEQDYRAQVMLDQGRRGEWPSC